MANRFTPKTNKVNKFNPSSGGVSFRKNGNSGSSDFHSAGSLGSGGTSKFSQRGSFEPPHTPDNNNSDLNNKKPKKKSHKKLVMSLCVLALLGGGGYYYYHTKIDTGLTADISYSKSKDYTMSSMISSWGKAGDPTSYNTNANADVVQNSYITKDIKYFNRDKQRMKFFQTVLNNVQFEPKSRTVMTRQGKLVQYRGQYADDKYTFKIPDYSLIEEQVLNVDYNAIQEAYKQRKLDKDDYNYNDELINLFADYVSSLKTLPTKTVTVSLPTVNTDSGYVITDDSKLDDILFASDSFHSLNDTFAAVANGDIGQRKDNPAHDIWQSAKDKYNNDLYNNIKSKIDTQYQNKTKTDKSTAQADSETNKHTDSTISELDRQQKAIDNKLASATKKDNALALHKKAYYLTLDRVEDTPVRGVFKTKSTSSQDSDTDSSIYALYAKKQQQSQALQQAQQNLTNKKNAEADLEKQEDQAKKNPDTYKDFQAKQLQARKDQEVAKTQEKLAEQESKLEQSTTTLSRQEKAIGVEPPKQIFIRQQVDNPDWNEWNSIPDKTGLIEPVKQVNTPLKAQQYIKYTWVGANYLLHNYKTPKGVHEVIKPQQGDGTPSYPATLGTIIQTKMHDSAGNEHDVKVRVTKILEGKKADDYVAGYDNRNSGFDTHADATLVVIEFEVQNLENKDNHLVSGFQLVDKDGNPIARTGTLYSLKTEDDFKPKDVKVMQDWFYTQDPNSLYLTWGKDFNKKYPLEWFKVLGYDNSKVTSHPKEDN